MHLIAVTIRAGYNRDLSVLAIRTWSEMVNAEKQAARLAKRAKNDDKKRKKENSKKRTIDQVEAEDEGQPDAPLHKAEGAAPQDKVAICSLPSFAPQR